MGVEKGMGHKGQESNSTMHHNAHIVAAAVSKKACLRLKWHRAVKKSAGAIVELRHLYKGISYSS